MAIVLGGRSEQVIVPLQRRRDPAVQNQRVANDFLIRAAEIDARRVDRLADARTAATAAIVVDHDAAVAFFPGHAQRWPSRSGPAVIPEHARTHDAARVSGQVVPAVVIDVVLRLMMAAGEQRCADLLRQPAREEPDAVGRADG